MSDFQLEKTKEDEMLNTAKIHEDITFLSNLAEEDRNIVKDIRNENSRTVTRDSCLNLGTRERVYYYASLFFSEKGLCDVEIGEGFMLMVKLQKRPSVKVKLHMCIACGSLKVSYVPINLN